MQNKHSLEQSIEKTISILGKIDMNNLNEFDKYAVMLTNYLEEYKIEVGYVEPVERNEKL